MTTVPLSFSLRTGLTLRCRPLLTRSAGSFVRNRNYSSKTSQPENHDASDAFPLDKPSWSISKFLSKPTNVKHIAELDRDLTAKEIRHLYDLAGLPAPDPTQDAQAFERTLQHINQLRDLLSHLRTVSETEDLDSVEPLVRIVEPIEFTAEAPDGGVDFTQEANEHLGTRVLGLTKNAYGSYISVRDQ
ncbi:hypothetical protein LPJ73_003015 [Coemansia sp. RSA 2703]|nr:hypothetical protein LPJ73_003015 [Coemansia sp. RSA 2703]KAJ2368789.1 hypothetical protein IW150_005316 [Coemansia sp. RSA 2607]KAJ2396263.1 hypothetical protein GGI05_001207 [Coemansia sp. RSA 2603]